MPVFTRENSDYLGDGVYAFFNGYAIVLLANDPYNPTDTIHIEASVLRSLNNFAQRMELQ
jgi:hypothetical protein